MPHASLVCVALTMKEWISGNGVTLLLQIIAANCKCATKLLSPYGNGAKSTDSHTVTDTRLTSPKSLSVCKIA